MEVFLLTMHSFYRKCKNGSIRDTLFGTNSSFDRVTETDEVVQFTSDYYCPVFVGADRCYAATWLVGNGKHGGHLDLGVFLWKEQ
jgi:hypothetical protein